MAQVASQALVGHIGPDELAAASIGITWFNLMVCWRSSAAVSCSETLRASCLQFYLLLGLASALDTLGAQACSRATCLV